MPILPQFPGLGFQFWLSWPWNAFMSACQSPVDGLPEWKPLPLWFPVNTFLQPLPITVLHWYPFGILDPSIAKTTCQLGFGAWTTQKKCYFWFMTQICSNSALPFFQPPLCCSISPGIGYMLPSDSTVSLALLWYQIFFEWYSLVRKWSVFTGYRLRNSQKSDLMLTIEQIPIRNSHFWKDNYVVESGSQAQLVSL